MKLDEIRNKMFGLSDLKSLINENAFDEHTMIPASRAGKKPKGEERYTFGSFFREKGEEYPNISFKQALGLDGYPIPKIPKTEAELSNFQFDDNVRTEMRSRLMSSPLGQYFELTPEEADEIIERIRQGKVFGKGSTLENTFNTAKKVQNRKLQLNNDFVSDNNSIVGQADKRPQSNGENRSIRPIDIISNYFYANGGSEIEFSDDTLTDMKNLSDYLGKIREIVIKTFNDTSEYGRTGKNINDLLKLQFTSGSKIIFENTGKMSDPFFMFLYVYYYYMNKKGILVPVCNERFEQNIINSLVGQNACVSTADEVIDILNGMKMEYDDFSSFIENTFLLPLNLRFFDAVTEQNTRTLYETYFINESSVERYLASFLSSNIKPSLSSKYVNRLGCVLAVAAFILMFDKNSKIEKLSSTVSGFVPLTEYDKMIRMIAYFVKYKNDFAGENRSFIDEHADALAAAFGVNTIYDLFDISSEIRNGEISSALQNLLGINAREQINEGDRLKMDISDISYIEGLASLGLPNYGSVFSLTPFERMVDMAKGGMELIKRNFNFDIYGGEKYGLISNIFRSAGDVYADDTGAQNKVQALRQNAESVYGEDLTYGQLLSYDSGQRDKTQREIYNFLVSKLGAIFNFNWEYNRKPNPTFDTGLGKQSIDILCTTYPGKLDNLKWIEMAKQEGDKTLCIEYQGEYHFRPGFMRPKNYSDNPEDGVIYWYTQLKNELMDVCKENTGKLKGRWFNEKDTDLMIMSTYENMYRQISGLDFQKTYEEFNPFLETLDSYKERFGLNEAKRSTMYQSDEEGYIKEKDALTEVLQVIYAVLIQYNKIPKGPKTDIPDGFRLINAEPEEKSKTYLSKVYPAKKKGYLIEFMGSPKRYAEELHTLGQKASDKDKSVLVKKRDWQMMYILPSEFTQTTTEEDFEYTKSLANPSSLVFRWDEGQKDTILASVESQLSKSPAKNEPDKEPGEDEIVNEGKATLFQTIIKELFGDSNFQLN